MKKTPLYAAHINSGAKMVDFHGWNLPLHYGSQLEEHDIVRQHAGMFDVSHMTIIDILGAGGRQFLRKLLTNDIDQLRSMQRGLYSCMCNEHGGILDDLIVYQRSSDNYRLILNSATREKDLTWIRTQSTGFAVGLQERNDLAMIAVQGPKAITQLISTLTPSQIDPLATLAPFECIDIDKYFVARTGYTGEDGVEIIVPQEEAVLLWSKLLQASIKPCGLAARDTLRLEAGLLLYGQDMDNTTTPLTSGLGWTVKWQPEDRDFIGMGALLSQKQQGLKEKLIGLILQAPGIMRSGQTVWHNDKVVGNITSGTYAPTLKKSIALARIQTDIEDNVMVEIRNNLLPASIQAPRFVKKGQIIS